ncbi:MAG: ATP-binding protein, partial [Oscillospiraceae bacterium]
MKSVEGKIRKAVAQYGLIEAGDCVAVGLSGGKDSLAMLVGLAGLMKYSEIPFSLRAVTLDMCFGGKDTDFSPVTKLCESMGVEHIVKRTNLAEVIFDIRKEQNPCALCSRMRRGALHDMSIECGCNKIALGHHMDDVVETLFMNLFNEGRLETFRPK